MNWQRKLVLAILGLLLLFIGSYVDLMYEQIDLFYRQVFGWFGYASLYNWLTGQVFNMKVLTLILVKTTFCLCILLVLFRDRARRRIILWAYPILFFASLMFALLVKLTGDAPAARLLSRNIIDIVLLTPAPIVLLTPVLTLLSVPASNEQQKNRVKAGEKETTLV